MKTLRVAVLSFFFGTAISVATVVGYACSDAIYVQDANDCHMYHRYVLVGSSSSGGVEVCAYEDCSCGTHREDTCDVGPIIN